MIKNFSTVFTEKKTLVYIERICVTKNKLKKIEKKENIFWIKVLKYEAYSSK